MLSTGIDTRLLADRLFVLSAVLILMPRRSAMRTSFSAAIRRWMSFSFAHCALSPLFLPLLIFDAVASAKHRADRDKADQHEERGHTETDSNTDV